MRGEGAAGGAARQRVRLRPSSDTSSGELKERKRRRRVSGPATWLKVRGLFAMKLPHRKNSTSAKRRERKTREMPGKLRLREAVDHPDAPR